MQFEIFCRRKPIGHTGYDGLPKSLVLGVTTHMTLEWFDACVLHRIQLRAEIADEFHRSSVSLLVREMQSSPSDAFAPL
jgi:hypothetical protein